MVAVAENTADELARSDGREVQLEEDPDLQLPFLLPEDGYSCDVVRSLPNGLQDFLEPLLQRGFCRLVPHPRSPGTWTVHFEGADCDSHLSAADSSEMVRPPPSRTSISLPASGFVSVRVKTLPSFCRPSAANSRICAR